MLPSVAVGTEMESKTFDWKSSADLFDIVSKNVCPGSFLLGSKRNAQQSWLNLSRSVRPSVAFVGTKMEDWNPSVNLFDFVSSNSFCSPLPASKVNSQ